MTAGDGGNSGAGEPTVLHVDMDAFFASVEVLRRPDLQGKPVLVGGTGPRGVVAAASYPARVFGVRSAMPMSTALRLCPQAVVLPGDHSLYRQTSSRIMAIFRDVTPAVEPLSLDEAFLDVSSARSLLGAPDVLAAEIRNRILDQEGLRCSVGVARTKHVAKLASDAAKPQVIGGRIKAGLGVLVVAASDEQDFLRPLPIRAMWGVGPKTADKLARLGVRTVGDIADLEVDSLIACVGEAVGRHVHALANGVDDRQVEVDRPVKSISQEVTFPFDVMSPSEVNSCLVSLADAVAARLRSSELFGRTISIKVRLGSFETMTRSVTLTAATSTSQEIAEVCKVLFADLEAEKDVLSHGIRLLGVAAGGLSGSTTRQLRLDLEAGGPITPQSTSGDASLPHEGVDEAVDEIRTKFGDLAIGRGGRSIRPDKDAQP